jgi:hypothetical protein
VDLKNIFWLGIFGSPWSFIGGYSFFLISATDAVFLTHSATFHPHPTT